MDDSTLPVNYKLVYELVMSWFAEEIESLKAVNIAICDSAIYNLAVFNLAVLETDKGRRQLEVLMTPSQTQQSVIRLATIYANIALMLGEKYVSMQEDTIIRFMVDICGLTPENATDVVHKYRYLWLLPIISRVSKVLTRDINTSSAVIRGKKK